MSSGKVKCTCGWSWNKSDSSKKDMYICHECGRDNSNNMKNGGWLDNYGEQDNYNDSQASAPEGMEGDGFSNVGRNYSPAWGGQFQNGGKAPKYVESKNDPRYTAYQDSLVLYEGTKNISKLLHDRPIKGQWKESEENIDPKLIKKIIKTKTYNQLSSDEKNVEDQRIKQSINPNIKPYKYEDYVGEGPKYKKSHFFSPDTYSKERTIYEDFKKPNFFYKKPQQQVIVKDNNAPQYKTIHTGEGEGRFEPIQRQPIQGIQNNLQPSGLVQGDFDIDADAEIQPEVRHAKSWKYNTREGRSEESGYVNSPEDMDYYTRLKDFYQTGAGKGLGNKVEITPQYQMGGSVYPVNYVPEAQGGMSLPGATGHMYARYEEGGKVPGDVGFSYPRTGEIPSNGPGAKKTMASAQNGKEMQFYQNGLDFQPKTISRDGAWLDKAQTGAKKFKLKDERDLAYRPAESTNIKKKNFDLEQDKERKNYLSQLADQQKENSRRKKLTQDQREREDYNARNEERGSIQAHIPESTWDRSKAIASNPLTAFGYAARNQSLPARFQHGERNVLDNAIDWVNPLQGVAAASEIPGELGRGEYLNAGLSLLDVADLGAYAKGAMKVSKPLLQKAGKQLGNIPTNVIPKLGQPILSNASNAASSFGNKTKSFVRNNILTDKNFNRLETVSNSVQKLNKAINPFHHIDAEKSLVKANAWMDDWYNSPITKDKIKEVYGKYAPNPHQENILLNNIENKNYLSEFESNLNKFDNFTSGQPRVHKGNYGVSGYYLDTNKNLSKRQNLVDKYIDPDMITSTAIHEGNHGLTDGNYLVEGYQELLHSPFNVENFKPRLNDGSFEKPSDYLLDPTEINARLSEIRYEHGLKPGENLTPERVDEILEKGISGKSKVDPEFFKLINDRNAFKNMMNYIPAAVPVVGAVGVASQLNNTEEVPEYEQGGIIKDDRGQWDHPGEITEIGSNDITMEGVPYDVLGISDTGDTKLMKPGKNYKFKGKKVTEYPMAKNGLRQEQKGLQNLDNLTNFTNYNKPQPGGWLNKYN